MTHPILRPIEPKGEGGTAVIRVTLEPSEPEYTSTTAVAGELGHKAATGAAWISLSIAAAKLLGFATTIILARLLTPVDFGLVGFAMIFIGAITLLQSQGVPAAVIYSREDVNRVGGTALTLNFGAATALAILIALLAPGLAWLSGRQQVGPVTAVLALGLVFSSTGSVYEALLMKAMAFRRQFVADMVALVIEGVISITLAFLGFGVWSLVLGYLSLSLSSSVLCWRLSPCRPRFCFNRSVAAELVSYSKHVWFNAITGFGSSNVDFLIVGIFLGASPLGLYTMAYNVAFIPCSSIANAAKTALFPALTQIRDKKHDLRRLFENAFTVTWSISIGVGLTVFVVGPAYMTVLLGSKWDAISHPLDLLAIYGTLASLSSVFPALYRAIGRPNVQWWFTLSRLVLVAPLMLISVRFGFGIIGVAYAQIMASSILVPVEFLVFSRVTDAPIQQIGKLVGPQIASLISAMLTWVLLPKTHVLTVVTSDRTESITLLLVAVLAAYVSTLSLLNQRLLRLVRGAVLTGVSVTRHSAKVAEVD